MSKTDNRPRELCVRDRTGCIIAWAAGYSDDDLAKLLEANPGSYRSIEYMDHDRWCDPLE